MILDNATLEKRLSAMREAAAVRQLAVNDMAIYQKDLFLHETVNPTAGPLHCYSITKNFTATAVGIAADEGYLSLDDSIVKFFGADELPEAMPSGWREVTLRHLLAQTTGIGEGILFESDRYDRKFDQNWLRRCFMSPLPYKPGEKFVYSNSNFFLLSAALRRATGIDVEIYLRKKLLDPLEIYVCAFERSREGDVMGATGMFMYTWDMLKLGRLYLNDGVWADGKRLLSAEWVNAALTDQDKLDGGPRYGYSFWLADNGVFECNGANGQLVRVFPKHGFIFAAHGCGEPDYGALLREFIPELFI